MKEKHFTREQFIKALEAMGFELVEETKDEATYISGHSVRVIIDHWDGVRIQNRYEKDEFFPEPFWSELAHTAYIDDVIQLPCDDEIYGKCFITSSISSSGNSMDRVYYLC